MFQVDESHFVLAMEGRVGQLVTTQVVQEVGRVVEVMGGTVHF